MLPANAKYPVDIALDYLAKRAAADHPGVDGLEGRHASAETRRHVAAERIPARQGKNLRSVVIAPGATEDQFTTNVQFTYIIRPAHCQSHRQEHCLYRL